MNRISRLSIRRLLFSLLRYVFFFFSVFFLSSHFFLGMVVVVVGTFFFHRHCTSYFFFAPALQPTKSGLVFLIKSTDSCTFRNITPSVCLCANPTPVSYDIPFRHYFLPNISFYRSSLHALASRRYDVHVDGAKDSRLASGISRLGNCSSQVQIHSHVFARPAFALL